MQFGTKTVKDSITPILPGYALPAPVICLQIQLMIINVGVDCSRLDIILFLPFHSVVGILINALNLFLSPLLLKDESYNNNNKYYEN